MKHFIFLIIVSCTFYSVCSANPAYDTTIIPAIAHPDNYIGKLAGRRVAIVINQTSEYKGVSLLDILLTRGVDVKRIFVPEHGFRGNADAGAHIANGIDSATGLPVVSLYGSNKKLPSEYLDDIDVLVYDLQDVGVRFYTYISTLQYCMEACAKSGKPLIILDRPNPNGFYVDGPVLKKEHSSFVGMQPIPIVYGMTAGEYAHMLVGEKWITGADQLKMEVIKCINYSHSKKYRLPVPPSPNLRSMEAVYAYPSLCLFEGTAVSVGRGTDKPFCLFGCPGFEGKFSYSFTPHSGPGSKHPPYEDKMCYGELVAKSETGGPTWHSNRIELNWLIKSWAAYPTKDKFFTSFFTKLSGDTLLESQLKQHMSEGAIRKSWQSGLESFKKTRKKYLLYADFE